MPKKSLALDAFKRVPNMNKKIQLHSLIDRSALPSLVGEVSFYSLKDAASLLDSLNRRICCANCMRRFGCPLALRWAAMLASSLLE